MAKAPRKAPTPAANEPKVSPDIQRVAVVPPPPGAAGPGITTMGPALTPGQQAGLDPIDPERNAEQAADRSQLTNMQTDHEAENALDPVSGGPTPGVVDTAPLTAKATGAPVTDESGRPALSSDDKETVKVLRQRLTDAKSEDGKNDKLKPDRRGWRTPAQMGIPGAVVKRIAAAYPEKMQTETVPNGHFFPETGTRYRLA
jgi:hypothetical protein